MPLILNNGFAHDSYALRAARLSLLSSHIATYTVELALPVALETWATCAFTAWNTAHVSADSEKGEMDVAFEEFQIAFDELIDRYQRVKDLLWSLITDTENGDEIAAQYGITGTTPEDFHTLYERCKLVKETTTRLTAEGDPRVLSPAIIDGLDTDADAVMGLWQVAYSERKESQSSHQVLQNLYKEDAQKLRLVYNYCTLTWGKYSPNLVELGFAIAEKQNAGQPDQPVNFALSYDAPTLFFTWNAVENTTSYQLTYSADREDWEELYSGELNEFSYEPPTGLRYYRVRARNVNGYGKWSDIISHEVVS